MEKHTTKLASSSIVSFREEVTDIPSTTYGTFGLYRYPAKFIPQIISYIIREFDGEPGTRVFDPFAGSGTVGLVSRMYGINYELWDLNPMLEVLHEIAIMKPPQINVESVTKKYRRPRVNLFPRGRTCRTGFLKMYCHSYIRLGGFTTNKIVPC